MKKKILILLLFVSNFLLSDPKKVTFINNTNVNLHLVLLTNNHNRFNPVLTSNTAIELEVGNCDYFVLSIDYKFLFTVCMNGVNTSLSSCINANNAEIEIRRNDSGMISLISN